MMRFPPEKRRQHGVIYPFLPGAWSSSGEANATDPYFSDVVNLSHFDGTNGSTTFVDSSSKATNLTAGTGTTIATAQSKFGGASLDCANSSNHGANSTGNTIYKIGTSDVTLEFWVYISTTTAQNLCYFDVGDGNSGFSNSSGNILRFWNGGTSHDGATSITINTWHFVAYSRTSTTGKTYLDGVQQASFTDSFNYSHDTLYVGCYNGFTAGLSAGNIDDFRLTIGIGRYSSSCPVPTAPFPNH